MLDQLGLYAFSIGLGEVIASYCSQEHKNSVQIPVQSSGFTPTREVTGAVLITGADLGF